MKEIEKKTIPILINTQKWIIAFCFCAIAFFSNGQSAIKNWSLEPSIHIGKIVKHSPKLLFDVEGLTTAVELNFNYQTFGKKEWHQHQRYPKMGVSLIYHDLGAMNIFGEALSLIPNLTSTVKASEKLHLGFRFGIGLAYLTRPYDPIDNRTNNAIGSNWNAGVLFGFDASWKLNEHWQIKSGLSLLHYSNGASHLPNFGFNIPSFVLGARYTPLPLSSSEYLKYDLPKKKTKRWGVQAWTSLAFRERGIPNGPTYPVYTISLGANYYLNKVNRLIGGVEYEYNHSVFEYARHVDAFDSEEDARRASRRYQVFIADEFLFGRWGVTVLTGTYLNKERYLSPWKIYNKIITRYYFPVKGRMKIHVGAYLKSHLVIAEYMAFGLGVSF